MAAARKEFRAAWISRERINQLRWIRGLTEHRIPLQCAAVCRSHIAAGACLRSSCRDMAFAHASFIRMADDCLRVLGIPKRHCYCERLNRFRQCRSCNHIASLRTQLPTPTFSRLNCWCESQFRIHLGELKSSSIHTARSPLSELTQTDLAMPDVANRHANTQLTALGLAVFGIEHARTGTTFKSSTVKAVHLRALSHCCRAGIDLVRHRNNQQRARRTPKICSLNAAFLESRWSQLPQTRFETSPRFFRERDHRLRASEIID